MSFYVHGIHAHSVPCMVLALPGKARDSPTGKYAVDAEGLLQIDGCIKDFQNLLANFVVQGK